MAVRVITAPPGFGKTLNMTRIALQLFNEHNEINFMNELNDKIHKREKVYKVNIYSNYPILLKKSKKDMLWIDGAGNLKSGKEIYSNKMKFTDMCLSWNFCDNASFFIDEIAFTYDSMEYKDFPDAISHFFMIHRHLSYNMIYTNSQSVSRIIKRVLCVSEEYWNVISMIKFLPFYNRVKFKITYDIKSTKDSENIIDDRQEIVIKWFNKRKVYNAYDTKYLSELKKGLQMYNKGQWTSKRMTKEEILNNFIVSKEEKERLKELEF